MAATSCTIWIMKPEKEIPITLRAAGLSGGAHCGRILLETIWYLGDNDSTSKRMMEEILANEEEYADDMKTLLERVGKEKVTARMSRVTGSGQGASYDFILDPRRGLDRI